MGQGFYGLKVLVLIADLVSTSCALFLATIMRYSFSWRAWPEIGARFSWFIILYTVTFVGLMYYFGNYRFEELPGSKKLFIETAKAHLLLLAFSYMYIGLLHYDTMSRLIVFGLVIIQFLLTFYLRLLLRLVLHYFANNGYVRSYTLVVGSGESALKFISEMKRHSEFATKIIGVIDDVELAEEQIGGVPVLGKINDIYKVFYEHPIDEVFITLNNLTVKENQELMSLCRLEGKSVHMLLEGIEPDEKFRAAELYGSPTLSVLPIQPTWARFLKRIIDFGLAGVALVVLSPVMIIVALLIKLTSPGPVFFVQERIGQNGRRIHVFKFRTMVVNAETLKNQLRHLNEVDGPVFKIKGDPRITKVGRFLRKTSLDELPQLFNVVMGQMSLVGPRPLPTKEALECTGWQRKRMAVKPGLTCTWQVSGRNEISFEEWMKMDTQYIDKWSLWLDLKIILKTVPEVFGMHGM